MTQILEGPVSDPSLNRPTDPNTLPPSTRVAPRPALPAAAPQPVRTRRRGRALALLVLFALAGAATGGALAYYGVELPNEAEPRLPTARAAVGAIRGFGDYTTPPRYDSVEVSAEVPVVYSTPTPSPLCSIIDILCDEDDGFNDVRYDFTDVVLSVNGSIGATVAIGSVDRGDLRLRRRTIEVYAPGAWIGEPFVDTNSIAVVDGDEVDPDDLPYDEIVASAADEIESRALDAGLRKDAQRAARRMIVHRLHSIGFRHVVVYYS